MRAGKKQNALNSLKESVSVVGLGRVGLITLFHLSRKKFSPCGVDINKALIRRLRRKSVPFPEPGFDALLEKHHSNIRFSTVLPDTKYYFIAVPTPYDSSTGRMDLSCIFSVLSCIKRNAGKKYVFIRSTLAPGSLHKISRWFKSLNPALSLSYFPEFFREGCFVEDYKKTVCSVLGSEDEEIFHRFAGFQFSAAEFCSPEEAEILKSVSNLFHSLKICFANETGRMAKLFHSSPDRIMELFFKDTRLNISKAYLRPGFSFGGPCLGKDIQSLHSVQKRKQTQWFLPQCVEKSNAFHTQWTAERILQLKPKKIGILGCSFTGNRTQDYRDSAVLKLVDILSRKKNLRLYGVEKELKDHAPRVLLKRGLESLSACDVLVLGGWTPLMEKGGSFLLNYKGRLFDLLIQEIPQYIKNRPNYLSLYTD